MWNPNISLKKWLNIHPDLSLVLPFKCSCGNELEALPYVSSEWIGLESTACSCELKESFCSGFSRNKEINAEALQCFIVLNNEELTWA